MIATVMDFELVAATDLMRTHQRGGDERVRGIGEIAVLRAAQEATIA